VRLKVKQGCILVAILAASFLVISSGTSAVAKVRSCGQLHGGHVAVLRGAVKCRTARRVLAYATNHHAGNGPGSPRGWECFRIAGDPHWTGIECISPPGSDANPRNHIADRNRI
jgi:hypothetical protein